MYVFFAQSLRLNTLLSIDDVIELFNPLLKDDPDITLSAEERDIMILFYSEGYNSKEIGEILGLKDSTVRSKIKRATEKLREMLVI